MNNETEVKIRKDIKSLNKSELVEMILFLMRTSPVSAGYTLPGGYDVPRLVQCIRMEVIHDKMQKLLADNERLLQELSECRRKLPRTSMTAVSILNRLEDNAKQYKRLSDKLDELEAPEE